MKYEDVELFRKLRRRVIIGTAGCSSVALVVGIITLAFVFSNIDDVGTIFGLILLLVLIGVASHALLIYAVSVESEKDRRQRVRLSSFSCVLPLPYSFSE